MEPLALSQMLGRLLVALALGIVMGFEREVVHKDAGVKTSMLVAGGACLFTLATLSIPFVLTGSPEDARAFILNSGSLLHLIGNIVVGIGFIGGGIIIKNHRHVQGLTTAALVWVTSAIGILAGLGLWQLATVSALAMSLSVYLFRATGLSNHENRTDAGASHPDGAEYR